MTEFTDIPKDFKSQILQNLSSKLDVRGLNFHPGKICKSINDEIERQYEELAAESLKGVSIKNLSEAQHEAFDWHERNSAAYQEHKAQAELMEVPPKAVEQLELSPAKVVDIKSKSKSKGKK